MKDRQATVQAAPGPSDLEVIREVQEGNREAFRELIERYQDRVYTLLIRILKNPETARDIAQETFLKAYLNLQQYREEFKFSNWLLKIAQNLAFSHLRHVGVNRERLTLDGEDGPGASEIPDPGPLADPAVLVEEKVLGELVNKCVGGMSEKYRLVLTLRHTNDLSYQEIAETLGVPLGTVKFRLHQAYKLLSESLNRVKARK